MDELNRQREAYVKKEIEEVNNRSTKFVLHWGELAKTIDAGKCAQQQKEHYIKYGFFATFPQGAPDCFTKLFTFVGGLGDAQTAITAMKQLNDNKNIFAVIPYTNREKEYSINTPQTVKGTLNLVIKANDHMIATDNMCPYNGLCFRIGLNAEYLDFKQ